MRFYCENIEPGPITLSTEESRHLAVLRLKPGDTLELFDGSGTIASARLLELKKNSASVLVESIHPVEHRSRKIIIASSFAKGERFDWLTAKCVELGVDHICPILFGRTVKLGKDNSAGRLRNIAISAAKQSGNIILPQIDPPLPLADAFESLSALYPDATTIFGSPAQDSQSVLTFAQTIAPLKYVIAFIGPEGGLTDSEEEFLIARAAIPLRITSSILRIETAALALASILCAARDNLTR